MGRIGSKSTKGEQNSHPHSRPQAAVVTMAIVTGIGILWSPAFVWFYLTYPAAVSLFAPFWRLVAPHP
jgi:ABC-type long-subunit fatty acid transport system fused permease/ATPase subunit